MAITPRKMSEEHMFVTVYVGFRFGKLTVEGLKVFVVDWGEK
jgi:hypothetical protein